MLLLRLIVTLGVCWIVQCDLLDLYVQHMDETMRTMLYRSKQHPMNSGARVKRSLVEVEPVLRVGIFKKQQLNFDKDWLTYWRANKKKYYENDALDIPNKEEENLDPDQYEIFTSDFDKTTTTTTKTMRTLENAAEANASVLIEIAKPTPTIVKNEVKSIIPQDPTTTEERRKEWEDEWPVVQEHPDELDELTARYVDLEERFPMEDSEDFEKYEKKSQFEVINEDDEINPKAFDDPSLKRPWKSWGRVPKKYSPFIEKLLKETEIRDRRVRREAESRRDGETESWRNGKTESRRDGETESRKDGKTKSRVKQVRKPKFIRYEVLDEDGDVILEWDPLDEEEVIFRVTGRTLGYIGIGFNEKTNMKNADMLLAWVDNHTGVVNLLDSHGTDELTAPPVIDTFQDVRVLSGYQNGTHTVVTFSRKWDTCDLHDHQLSGDTIRVLWSLHDNDPELNMAAHHRKRGGRALRLKTAAAHSPPPPPQTRNKLQHWDVKLNQFTVSPNMDTIYWCKIFQSPVDQKHHMIGYTPLVEKANEDLVHHMILYECTSTSRNLSLQSKLAGASCYSSSPLLPDWQTCVQPVLAWARGSKGEWLPEHVGIPVAVHRNNTYYMLEIHYNNPLKRNVNDSSGVRLHLTSELRSQEAGIFVAGVAVSPLHLVPPRQKAYATAGYCSRDCTHEILPAKGINIISVVLHSHLAGRRLSLKHIREGKELPRIVQDNHFDFDYQQSHTLEKEVNVLPGDELVAECVYGTLDRKTMTLGGYAAFQEMCLAFVMHYPKTPLAACYSMTPVKDLFLGLGVKTFKGMSMDEVESLFLETDSLMGQKSSTKSAMVTTSRNDDSIIREAMSALKAMRDYSTERESDNVFTQLVIQEPPEFRNSTIAAHLQKMDWTDETLSKTVGKKFYQEGRHLAFCRKRDDTLALNATIYNFPEFIALPDENETICEFLRSVAASHTLAMHLVTVVSVLSVFML